MARFTGGEHGITSLDQELYPLAIAVVLLHAAPDRVAVVVVADDHLVAVVGLVIAVAVATTGRSGRGCGAHGGGERGSGSDEAENGIADHGRYPPGQVPRTVAITSIRLVGQR